MLLNRTSGASAEVLSRWSRYTDSCRRYDSASATCGGAIVAVSARSAIVRATFSTRWYARAVSVSRGIARTSSASATVAPVEAA